MEKAGEPAYEKVADGSTPRTGGHDATALSKDNSRSRGDDNIFIDYVLPAKVSLYSCRGLMLLILP